MESYKQGALELSKWRKCVHKTEKASEKKRACELANVEKGKFEESHIVTFFCCLKGSHN